MTEPVSDNMRIAQLQGHLKHCENEVNKAKNALDTAELHQRNAVLSLIAGIVEEGEGSRQQLITALRKLAEDWERDAAAAQYNEGMFGAIATEQNLTQCVRELRAVLEEGNATS